MRFAFCTWHGFFKSQEEKAWAGLPPTAKFPRELPIREQRLTSAVFRGAGIHLIKDVSDLSGGRH